MIPETEAILELREELRASQSAVTEQQQKKEQLYDERDALRAELKEQELIAAEAKEKEKDRIRTDRLLREEQESQAASHKKCSPSRRGSAILSQAPNSRFCMRVCMGYTIL